jgi:hypothetical protein
VPARILPRFKVQTFRTDNILPPAANEGPTAVGAKLDDFAGRPNGI